MTRSVVSKRRRQRMRGKMLAIRRRELARASEGYSLAAVAVLEGLETPSRLPSFFVTPENEHLVADAVRAFEPKLVQGERIMRQDRSILRRRRSSANGARTPSRAPLGDWIESHCRQSDPAAWRTADPAFLLSGETPAACQCLNLARMPGASFKRGRLASAKAEAIFHPLTTPLPRSPVAKVPECGGADTVRVGAMDDVAESPHDGRGMTKSPSTLERATATILELLDPVVEPRSMTDAIILSSDISQAVAVVRLWPEFSGLTVEDFLSVEDEVLRRIHQGALAFRRPRVLTAWIDTDT